MELNAADIKLRSRKTLFETTCEQSIDTDFALPDYYPEVTKILKCFTEIGILTKQPRNGEVQVGGQAVITLVYADPENNINSFVHIFPFAKIITAEACTENSHITVTASANYINSKATAPRKVEVHGSASLGISVSEIIFDNVLVSADCDEVYVKKCKKSFAEPFDTLSKSVFIEDEISVPQSKPPIGAILRSSARSEISECKFINGKAVVKGQLNVDVLYSPMTKGRPVLLSEQHGFSQIFDCDVSDENAFCEAVSEVSALELRPKTSLDGEIKSIAYEAKIAVDVYPFVSCEHEMVTDAFCTKFESNITYSDLFAETLVGTVNENCVCKKSIDMSGGLLNDIYDLWCSLSVDFSSYDGGELIVKGTVTISLLGSNSDGEPTYLERPVDYEYRSAYETDSAMIHFRPHVKIAAVNYSLGSDGKIDFTAELTVTAKIFAGESIRAVATIKPDENSSIFRDEETAVTLYYSEGETVWQIARKYFASPDRICASNNISDVDSPVTAMLLIPNI